MTTFHTKPPRYLLREAMLLSMLSGLPTGRFLEIGHGSGNMLQTLADLGYWGEGYDFSETARAAARDLLVSNCSAKVRLIRELPDEGPYDYIFFFEVIGYWNDPIREITRLKDLLSSSGKLVFSFTAKKSGGFAEKATGNMACFTREEIVAMLEHVPLRTLAIRNYGFPLSNLMKPFLNIFYYVKSKCGNNSNDLDADVKHSGMASRHLTVRLASIIINSFTIYPFLKLQHLFKDSDLGTGYIVIAGKK